MPKDFNVYLRGWTNVCDIFVSRLKEDSSEVINFNMYLKGQTHELDIYVISLPYRDGITVTNRLLLTQSLKSIQTLKSAEAHTSIALNSNIAGTLQRVFETADNNIDLNAVVAFNVWYALHLDDAGIVPSNDDLTALIKMYADANSQISVGVAPLQAYTAVSLGGGETELTLSQELDGLSQQGFITCDSDLDIGVKDIETFKTSYAEVSTDIQPTAELENLLYRLTTAGSSAVELSAIVSNTELHYSFGNAFSSIALRAELAGTNVEKGISGGSGIALGITITESAQSYADPKPETVVFGVSCEFILKRHRLLTDMDNNGLSTYDGMSLEDADYVIL